jgi:BlaI family penicillinase repressor
MKELTKAEDQIMQVLWALEKGFVKDIIDKLPEPKPAYNTVSTIVRILKRKALWVTRLLAKRMNIFL